MLTEDALIGYIVTVHHASIDCTGVAFDEGAVFQHIVVDESLDQALFPPKSDQTEALLAPTVSATLQRQRAQPLATNEVLRALHEIGGGARSRCRIQFGSQFVFVVRLVALSTESFR